MANILVLGVKVPFRFGGQEVLVKSLTKELTSRGHNADIVELPFNLPNKEAILMHSALWRAIDFREFAGTKVDLVIATKFPSYFASHPKKSLWLVHQHRPAYDLFCGQYSDFSDDPNDEAIRKELYKRDAEAISSCEVITGISKNVVNRLKEYSGISAEALYPPLPMGGRYRSESFDNYILSVGRLCGIKRVDFIVKAMPLIQPTLKLKIVGQEDEPGVLDYLQNEVKKHKLEDRVQFLGRVSDEELLSLYANAMAVYYAPHNEDYGYVTLEALASGKPVVTAIDSGGVLEFITDRQNGIVVEPTLQGIADGFNLLLEDDTLRKKLSDNALADIQEWGLGSQSSSDKASSGWDRIIEKLLSPIL